MKLDGEKKKDFSFMFIIVQVKELLKSKNV